ncbi:MAG TPA: DUF3048 domain-containing protein [Jiangellaceae bacterium]
MSANRSRHKSGSHTSSGRLRLSWLGIAAVLLALVGTLALIYVNEASTPDALGSMKLVGSPRAATPTPTETAVVADVEPRAPLTGLPTEGSLAHAAVTVKVSNTPDAHPHRGLEAADIVFVEPITGATTRLAAMFHSTLPDEVGPVRSLRPMDAPIVGPTGGVLANTMAQQWVLDYVDTAANVANLGTMRVPRGTYRIDNSRIAPNHVFAQPLVLLGVAERTQPPPPYFQYADDPDESTAQTAGSPAVTVTIDYGGTSTATWQYDEEIARWRRSEAWSDHIMENGEQVTADNVIVLSATREFGFAQASADMTVLDLEDSSGSLQLFTGANTVEGRWRKAGPNDPFEFSTVDGAELLLTPGTTWIELALDTMRVTIDTPAP